MKSAIQVFHDWSLNGKDEGMEKVHSSSVEEMLTFVLNNLKEPFSFIDAGCGNGWAVRRVLSNPLCKSATGIDGATGMIDKAKTLDSEGNYTTNVVKTVYTNHQDTYAKDCKMSW